MLFFTISFNIINCLSVIRMINDDFLEEVPNPNNYSLMNCPPEWWDKGFVISKPSNRTFLFKHPTKDFDKTLYRLNEYGNLFDDHLIRFSYLSNSGEFKHLIRSVSKNIVKDGEFLPGAERYEISYTSADTFETTFRREKRMTPVSSDDILLKEEELERLNDSLPLQYENVNSSKLDSIVYSTN